MNIEYVGRGRAIDKATRQFTEEKLRKVTKFLEEPIDIKVTLEVEKHRQIAEFHITHRHGVLQSTEEMPEMLDAINLAVDKAEKQARRNRKRFMDRRRRSDRAAGNNHHWPAAVVDAGALPAGSKPRVIKSTRLPVKPMTVDEAAIELEDSEHAFVVFRDATSDRVSVLYRRKDSHFGLISPEP